MSSKKPTKSVAVSARGLGKRYALAQSTGPRPTTLAEAMLGSLRGTTRPAKVEFWAVRDVDFDIYEGDVVGVVGRNGAGKSTLLKLLSRITEPTTGCIDLWGRVGSLLEVGTGFHPELTGRENIYLNGAILGMSRPEIARQFDAIVDFAEVENFLDTPVKRYSSGMYVRLAFAVAAHLNPEILIVDEVLAVGDAAFQKKCLGKMQDVARTGGRTVLFVSHSMAAVRSLCNRALLLRGGELVMDDTVESVVASYVQDGSNTASEVVWSDTEAVAPEVKLQRAFVEDDNGNIPVALECHAGFTLACEFETRQPTTNLRMGFFLQTVEGVMVCEANDPEWSGKQREPGFYKVGWRFPGFTLNEGRYVACFYADFPNDRRVIMTGYDLAFNVEDTRGYGVMAQKFPGVLRPDLRWSDVPLLTLPANPVETVGMAG